MHFIFGAGLFYMWFAHGMDGDGMAAAAECEEEVMTLECMHRFHKNCLTRYAEAKQCKAVL